MVNEFILNTVKKMFKSGLDENAVRGALSDLGLSDEEKELIIRTAKGKEPLAKQSDTKTELKPESMQAPIETSLEPTIREPIEEPMSVEHEKIVKKTTEKIKEHLEEKEAAEQFREATSQLSIDNHTQKLEEHGEKLEDVSKGITELKTVGKEALIKKLNSMDRKIVELKAQNKAIQKLLQQILETNRETLNKLN